MAKRFFTIALAIFILLPIFLMLAWYFKPKTILNILILDKTVVSSKGQEHISLSWVLTHEKYTRTDSSIYYHNKDYYGFFPDDKGKYIIKDFNHYNEKELLNLASKYDMAYYTDLYGVYSNEWIVTYYPDSVTDKRFISQRSKMYYGGLTQKELDLLKIFKKQNKLIINEFNIIAHPTPRYVRRDYEATFNIKWTGWVGRYFDSLDTLKNMDLPRWLIDNYRKKNQNKWPFHKSGIAFVNEFDEVVILENETHLTNELPYIYTSDEHADKYNLSKRMKYPFWFDIITVNPNENNVISEYKIETNASGESLLKKWNIPTRFPALVSNKQGLYYYLAGDFCDNPISMNTAKMRKIHWFAFITASDETADRASFFWYYYRPFIIEILKEYNSRLKKT